MEPEPVISIIIPVHNGEGTISQCLESVYDSKYKNFEVIIVDDCSTDGSLKIAEGFPCKIKRVYRNRGPAAARNLGAEEAGGELLFFIDSDVIIGEDNLSIIADSFQRGPKVDALQGVYNKEIKNQNIFSQYKNYYNYYKFQKVSSEFLSSISSFCFVIKKDIFQKVGGFDTNFPPHSAAEDVELGYRLKNLNYRTLLNREIRVTHLKSYSLRSFLRAEFIRVASNVKLFLRIKSLRGKKGSTIGKEEFPISKNRKKDMLNVILSVLMSPLIFISLLSLLFVQNYLLPLSVFGGLVITFIALNYSFLNLIRKDKGILFCLGCGLVTYLDMLTAQSALVFGLVEFKLLNKRY